MALLEVNHEASLSEVSDRLQGVFQHLSLLVSIDRDVIKLYHYRHAVVARLALEDGFHHELEVCGCLR